MNQPREAGQHGVLRTAEVSTASGYSVQQVRDLERLGVIPTAVRAANGYRHYTPVHVHALGAYRRLALAIGPVDARRLLAGIWSMTVADAAAEIGSLHVRLATERARLLQAQHALRDIRVEAGSGSGSDPDGPMGITELATALGVRGSTLRFWEQEGLVASRRVTSLRVRVYDPAGVRAARIVAALRSAGYRIPAVRSILASLDDLGGRDMTAAIVQHRLDDVATRAVALLEAGADLAGILRRGA